MMRSVMLSAMVLLLSSLGMLAGRGITKCVDDSVASPLLPGYSQQPDDFSVSAPSSTVSNTIEGAARSISAVSVSQTAPQTSGTTMTAFGNASRATAFDGTTSDTGVDADRPGLFDEVAPDAEGVSREAAAELIRREFPAASEEVIAGWSESFEGLAVVEVMGILQQKKLFSSSLDSSLPSSLSSPLPDAAIEPATHMAPAPPEESTTVELPGYRQTRHILMHNAGDKPNSTLVVTDFTPGKVIVTGFRSHAAINDSTGLVMFRLEKQTATRCGAFEVLSNRRVGVKLPSGEYPLTGLAPLPDDAEEFSLDESGTVVAQSKNGEFHPLGTIECLRLLDTRALRTTDSLAFDFSALPAGDFETVAGPILMQGKLELSNKVE